MFLPFSESDFIFSIIGEELGLIGAIVVIAVFAFMIFRAILIAQKAPDRFGCFLAGGIAAIIAIQVLINIAVVTGSIPPTGLPLPFVSAGSTSLIVFCSGVGILQSISLRSHDSVVALRFLLAIKVLKLLLKSKNVTVAVAIARSNKKNEL